MMEPESLEETIARGIHADRLLKDEIYRDAVKAAEEEFRKEWLSTEDRDKQFVAWAGTRALSAVEKQFRRFIAEGQHAAEVLRRRG